MIYAKSSNTFFILAAAFFANICTGQTFFANIQSAAPVFNNTVQLSIDNCDSSNVFTCAIPNNINAINYYDIAFDTKQNLYYGASDGRLFKRNLTNNLCEYLGSFNNFITALVADADGNIFAAGISLSNIGQLYKYNSNSHEFSVVGNLPSAYYSTGDLFFYEGKLFLLAVTPNEACILDINIKSPVLSCCYMTVNNLNPLVGAFSLKINSASKVYVASEDNGRGSNLYEVDMVNKIISEPICTYPFSILGCASLYDFTPSFSASFICGALPIKLSYFHLIANNGFVKLTWKTEMETNSKYFLIQRSPDGVHYEVIGKVDGAANSVDPRYYQFDDRPYPNHNYYRLQQFDVDGNYNYSEALYFNNQLMKPLRLLENYAKSVLHIQVSSGQNNEVTLYNMLGAKLKNMSMSNGNYAMDVSFLESGVYIIELTTSTGQTYHERFIKAR